MLEYLEKIDLGHPEFAEFYDELALWSAPFGLLLLERVPLRPGATVLDVGPGTGFSTLELAQRCGADSTIIAVDPWAGGMERLRKKVEHLGLRNVRLIEGDAAHVDVPDGSIDLIVSNLGINNFENADAVLQRCFRVARPGASLILTTNLVGHMREFYDVYRATLIELGQGDRIAALDAHIAHRATLESAAEMLMRAGFELTAVATDSFRMRFADGSSFLCHTLIRVAFIERWKEVPAVDRVEPTFAALERKLNDVAEERGELALTVPIACIEARRPG
jgi:ubiquinone/menaquinone biosynthesis C-methylase UbiE